jgi:uncharacterized protein (TIGR03437 family)
MVKTRKILILKGAAICAALPLLLYAFAGGPDPGHAGVPGESLCTQAGCHVGTAIANSDNLKVEFPGGLNYSPGVKQRLAVTISDADARRWGFQLTARRASETNAQAGTFAPTDNLTQVLPPSGALQYIEHTQAGTRLGQTGSIRFEFDWTPPATDVGEIVFYVAGNAANGNSQPTGDRIYTNTFRLAAGGGGGGAKPTIAQNGVVNGASFAPGIATGSWVTIQGSNLATGTRTWRSDEIVNGKLPTQLDGVGVNINGKPAAVYFISPTQINVQAPADDAVGPVNVEVVNGSTKSDPMTAQLQAFSPGFFLWDGKYAVATRPDFSLVAKPGLFPGATTVPAKPGDTIILWGTGFGPTNPAIPAGQTVDRTTSLVTNPTIRVGGATAQLVGGALSQGFAGLYQIAVRLPDTLADGDQKIEAEVGGIRSPDNVFITIQK